MDGETFLAENARHLAEQEATIVRRIFQWAQEHGLHDSWGYRNVPGEAYAPVVRRIEWEPIPFVVGVSPQDERLFEDGQAVRFAVAVGGRSLRGHNPFKVETTWQRVLDQVYSIPSIRPTPDGHYPWMFLSDLLEEQTWNQFFEVIERIIDELQRAAARGLS